MIFELGSQTNTRTIVKPQLFPFGLFLLNLQSFYTPKLLHRFMIYLKSFTRTSQPSVFSNEYFLSRLA